MMPPAVRKYLISALAGLPDVAERLLKDLSSDDSRWDFRPDPTRFTLREVVAHLADWEPINLERVQRMLTEENPTLPDIDEGKLAIENDYAHSDPHGSLEWIRGGRLKFVQELQTIDPVNWSRTGIRESVGPLTVETFATLVAAHDGYHTRQIAQWLTQAESGHDG